MVFYKNSTKKKRWTLVFLFIFIFMGVLGLLKIQYEKQTHTHRSNESVAEVNVLRLKAEKVTVFKDFPGRTVAYKIAEVRPQVSGIITERLFTEGSYVEEQQQLYQIAEAPYRAAYDSAAADLQKAKANSKSVQTRSERYTELVKIEAVSKQEFDDAQANLAQAQADIAIARAAVATAKVNLDYTKVYAPISGRIGKSLVTKGALVTANQAQLLATITQLDPIYVDITQSSASFAHLHNEVGKLENTPITLVLDDGKKEYEHQGKLQFYEVAIDKTTGSLQWRALFPNPDSQLLPGLFVRARLKLDYPQALLVPQKATQRDRDGVLLTWIIDQDNHAKQVSIWAKEAIDDAWLIDQGLKAGDVIVIEGAMNLKPNMLVHPVFVQEQQTTIPPHKITGG